VLISERVKTDWWRGAFVVAAVAVACFSASPFAGLFGLVPIVCWVWLAPSRKSGVLVGLGLLALLAWFALPNALGLGGSWVPADHEICVELRVLSPDIVHVEWYDN
jgi:hypothetical protein